MPFSINSYFYLCSVNKHFCKLNYVVLFIICVYDCSMNGSTWLPSELSMICCEHFLEMKSVDDPSFIPHLFPARSEDITSSVSQVIEKQPTEKDVLRDSGVLQKVVDRLPMLSPVDADRVGPARREADTSELQDTFRELACHVCRLLIAHDSELLIEGTVGVTVDGGARVMLLHFSDQVRKTEASNAEQDVQIPVSELTVAEGDIFHDVAKNSAKDGTVNKVQTDVGLSEEKIPSVGSTEYSTKVPSFTTPSPPQYITSSSKVLSDLAQQTKSTINTSSGLQSDAVGLSIRKRKAELDSNSVSDKPKQQTLLRELLCAPLPPKRLCRPVNAVNTAASVTTATSMIGEVVRLRRPTANSTVLGGLLRTGNYQRESTNFSPVGSIYSREIRPKPEPGTIMQGGYGGQHLGVDVHSSQFGGNAVRALLRLASEHVASGRHDLLRNDKHRESTSSQNESFATNGSADSSVDQRFNMLYQNLVGSDFGSGSSELISTGQNRSDSSTTTSSSSSLPVKQEVVDPGYE